LGEAAGRDVLVLFVAFNANQRGQEMKLVKYLDAQRQWRWHIKAANGRVLADSGEGYHNEIDCDRAVALIRSFFRGG
jgi:uncharacterized protein YegP (UPF0339 family)